MTLFMNSIPFDIKTTAKFETNYDLAVKLIGKDKGQLYWIDKKTNTFFNRFLAYEYGKGPLKSFSLHPKQISHMLSQENFLTIEIRKGTPRNLNTVKYAEPFVAYLSKKNRKSNALFTKIMTEAFNFNTDCSKPKFLQNKLLAIHKDTNGAHLTTINRKQYTLYNRLIALFGLGPLAKLDLKISSIAEYYLANLERRPDDFVPAIVTYFAYQAAKKGSFDLLLHLKEGLFYYKHTPDISISKSKKIYTSLLLPDHQSVLAQGQVFGEHEQQLACVLHLFSKDKREQVVKVFQAIDDKKLDLTLEDKKTLLKMLKFSSRIEDFSDLIDYIKTKNDINLEDILKKTIILNLLYKLDESKDKRPSANKKKENSNSNKPTLADEPAKLKDLKLKLIDAFFNGLTFNFNNIKSWNSELSACMALLHCFNSLNENEANRILEIIPSIPSEKRPMRSLGMSPQKLLKLYTEAYESTKNRAIPTE